MKTPRAGFTLLEVMIAVAFIGIALVAVIRTQSQGIRLSDEARFISQAVFLAKDVLARTQAEADLTPGGDSSTFEEPLDQFAWQREITEMAGLPGILQVKVRVFRRGEAPETGLTLTGFAYLAGQ